MFATRQFNVNNFSFLMLIGWADPEVSKCFWMDLGHPKTLKSLLSSVVKYFMFQF